ncbi:MAG: hypothetical protein L6R41_005034, partial [Letrouitia leprolyta]
MVGIALKVFFVPDTLSQDNFLKQALRRWGDLGVFDWRTQQDQSIRQLPSCSRSFMTPDQPPMDTYLNLLEDKASYRPGLGGHRTSNNLFSEIEYLPSGMLAPNSIEPETMPLVVDTRSTRSTSQALDLDRSSSPSNPVYESQRKICWACLKRPPLDTNQTTETCQQCLSSLSKLTYLAAPMKCKTMIPVAEELELPEPWDLEGWSKVDLPELSNIEVSKEPTLSLRDDPSDFAQSRAGTPSIEDSIHMTRRRSSSSISDRIHRGRNWIKENYRHHWRWRSRRAAPACSSATTSSAENHELSKAPPAEK